MNRISSKAQRILEVFSGAVVLISGSWLADGLKGEILFSDWSDVFANRVWGLLIASFSFSLAFSYGLSRLRHAFANIRSLSRHECDPHRSLILFVSTPSPESARLDIDSRKLNFQDGKEPTDLSGNLQQAIKNLNDSGKRWNWQQILRAIQPHFCRKKRLRRLHLIGSSGPRGSFGHLGICKEWLAGYLPGVEITTNDKPGVDFEDFNAMVQHIQETIDEQKKGGEDKEKFTDKDIVIDVTGGTKMASIAGSCSTLNTWITFQYVQNNSHEVYAYDVAYLPHEK